MLVLPYINMNPPQVYTCSPSWNPLPLPSQYHPSGSSQCTSPKHPVSCIKPGLATHFIYVIKWLFKKRHKTHEGREEWKANSSKISEVGKQRDEWVVIKTLFLSSTWLNVRQLFPDYRLLTSHFLEHLTLEKLCFKILSLPFWAVNLPGSCLLYCSYTLGMSFSRFWELSLWNVIINKDNTPVSQSLWKGRNLTSIDAN